VSALDDATAFSLMILKKQSPHADARALDMCWLEMACAQKGDVVMQLHAQHSLADAQLANKKLSGAAAGYRAVLDMIERAPKVVGVEAEAEAALQKGQEVK
jgi:hypothetical protein